MQTIADRLLLSLPEEIKKQQLETAKANYEASIDTSKPVTAKTIEKTFDKAVIKILSEIILYQAVFRIPDIRPRYFQALQIF